MKRGFWFAAGAGAGVYASARARRLKEAFTPEGLSDRWAGAVAGARLFADEVKSGMAERDAALREHIDLIDHGPRGLTRRDDAQDDTSQRREIEEQP